ncbi:MAG: type II toxin-antitoxin system Phd/YefM family antitoxin [Planctomycetaceae bacterium]|jgi:PHD/YefM family antitoxin component YafN of YafNO toxin-antitoxin module|nr:type II toxin-antitoxin system Phd/YefM family antitoxin [Planctomycetaceae bacterium]
MRATTIVQFRERCGDYFEQAVQSHEPITVTTDTGNAVIISEELYRGLIATLELTKDPRFFAELKEAIAEPLEECLDADEVHW